MIGVEWGFNGTEEELNGDCMGFLRIYDGTLSGKLTVCDVKPPFLVGLAAWPTMFNSKLLNYERVFQFHILLAIWLSNDDGNHQGIPQFPIGYPISNVDIF